MKAHGIFSDVHKDVGEILVADVNQRASPNCSSRIARPSSG